MKIRRKRSMEETGEGVKGKRRKHFKGRQEIMKRLSDEREMMTEDRRGVEEM